MANQQGGRDSTVDEVLSKIVSLKELMDERDRSYIERFASSEKNVITAMTAAEKAVSTAMAAAEKAVATAMSAAEKAVAKAEVAAEKRFDAVNEFRQQLADQQITFARSDAVSSAISMVTQTTNIRLDNLERHLDTLADSATEFHAASVGRGKGISDAWGWLIAIVMAGIAAMSFWGNRGP
jgi:hypothetical protein